MIIEVYNDKMNTFPHLKCPSCKVPFGFENTPKILKNCQHTICINCLRTLKSCPVDSVEINSGKCGIKSFLTNTQILQQIQNSGNKDKQPTQDRIFAYVQKETIIKKNGLGQSQNHSGWRMCNLHYQKATFICQQDHQFLCSSCLTAGSHKSHKVMSYEQMLQNLTCFTDSTYKIYDLIKEKSQILTKRKVDEYIVTQMNKRRQKQIIQIRSFYQKLFEKLRKQQKTLLQQLQALTNQSIKSLKQQISTNDYELKKQNFGREVYALTKVVDAIYNCEGFQKAFSYLNQNCQESMLIKKGENLSQQFSEADHNIRGILEQRYKTLQFSYNQQTLINIQHMCAFKHFLENGVKGDKGYSNGSTKPQKHSSINAAFSLSILCKHQPVNSSKSQQSQISDVSQSQSSEDFLLESRKETQQNQTIARNQITFEENFSLISPDHAPQQQFTPILKKQQDSITGIQQATLLNRINSQEKQPFLQVQSEQLTINFKQNRKNNLIATCIDNQSSQLSKTLIKERPRSPFTPLRGNTPTKLKRNQIPQKYINAWQAAKEDRSQLIDLTGAQLGDTLILHLGSYLSSSTKIRSLKLIRNKLTDEIVYDLINCINTTNISSINLSQNYLTQKSLQVLENIDLGNLKSITLSLNKIVWRRVKDRIEKFKQRGIVLTV